MKGLVEQTETNTIYLTVKHHSIVQESKTEREGFKPVEVKNPRTDEIITKHIKQYKAIEGLICKIEWYDTEDRYEHTFMGWKIHMNANGVPCVLDLPFDSRASNRLMKVAENLDFSQPVEFRAWHDRKTDSTAFFIGQHGEGVRQKYTLESPGKCPAPTQNPVTKKWNFEKQKEYLHKIMTDVVIPEVEEVGNQMSYLEPGLALTGPHAPIQDELEDDEIPF